MITIPQLDTIQNISPTDMIMITHQDGTSEKISGENFMKAMAVDVIAENNMNSVTSNAVAKKLYSSIVEISCSVKGKIRLIKIGKVVLAQYFESDGSTFNLTTLNQWVAIATIPEGYRPVIPVYFVEEGPTANGHYQIYNNGSQILFYRTGNYGWETAFNAFWITN